MVYLDNAATTQMSDEVIESMMPYMKEYYGNPSSKHQAGKEAFNAIERARCQVASLIDAEPNQIIFTSGGSEANNLALHGWINKESTYVGRRYDRNIIYSKGEHDSIVNAAEHASLYRDAVTTIPVSLNADGTVDTGHLEIILNMLRNNLHKFVSCMYVNNETGAVNHINTVSSLCLGYSAHYHMDCVQAAGFHPIDVNKVACSTLSLSSHKIHGPKGVGALYIRNTDGIAPIISGGAHQEFGLRGGTENVPGIVGFGTACEVAKRDFDRNREHISNIKSMFYDSLIAGLNNHNIQDRLVIHGPGKDTPGRIANFRITGIDGETMILVLGLEDEIYMSSGSACRSGDSKPSDVLTAMGISDADAHDAIRVSFSRYNTETEAVMAGLKIAEYASRMLNA